MPEAEDVLIDAAERASRVAVTLWRRHRPYPGTRQPTIADVEHRLEFLLEACFGDHWTIIPTDAPPRAGWLARSLGRPAPWQIEPSAAAFTDGSHLFLPRRIEAEGSSEDELRMQRLIALSLGARIVTGSLAHRPTAAIASDLFWIADGGRIDAWLAAELPGLAADVRFARRSALARRPALDRLSGAEREVEAIVRDSLAGALPVEHDARLLAEWAEQLAADSRFAGGYRGIAPVLHWGSPGPNVPGEIGAAVRRAVFRTARHEKPRRMRRLGRFVEARQENDEERRQGPFFVPFGDPPQTVQDPAGVRRPTDQGEDVDLDALASEIERLPEITRVRCDTPVAEILEPEVARSARATTRDQTNGGDGVTLRYPEWDHRTASYRPGHCLVREAVAPSGPSDWSRRVLERERRLLAVVRRRFERLRARPLRRPRERDGDELDLGAFVEDFADRRAGCVPSDRLYLSERRLRRDVTVAFLVDASGSTDAWVSGGRTVLDVEKEATLVVCESLASLGDRYAVYAFSSRGPRSVLVTRAKGFDESYGDAARGRIAGLAGSDYTRMGAPIRHLTSLLAAERGRAVRLLFLVSDGRPNDEDEYEGRYGIEDTRQAVAEARLQGVSVFCLTVDRGGSSYLPHLFGPQGYALVEQVTELPRRLPEIYRVLTERH